MLCGLLLLSVTLAHPVDISNNVTASLQWNPLGGRKYDPPPANLNPDILEQLLEGIHWSQLAYCTVWPGFTLGPLNEACTTYKFRRENTELVFELVPPGRFMYSGAGIVAVDHDQEFINLSFRGSATPADWLNDVDSRHANYHPVISKEVAKQEYRENDMDIDPAITISSEKYPVYKNCPDCYAHAGIYSSFRRFMPQVFAATKPYLDLGYKIQITGHSLGGGYALFAGLEYQLLGYNPRVITFGQLKVGNPEFAAWVDEVFHTRKKSKQVQRGALLPWASYFRVSHQSDVVPRYPGVVLNNFSHAGCMIEVQGYELPQNMSRVVFMGPQDPYEDWEFNGDTKNLRTYTAASAHMSYFIVIPNPAFKIR